MKSIICVCLIYLHLGPVISHTLYQWIIDSNTRFNYDPNPANPLGVYNWQMTYPEECSHSHQSPVNIDTTLVKYGSQCKCPTMMYKSQVVQGTFQNNGHSPTFHPKKKTDLMITDVPYRHGTYILNDFHLHFGGVSGRNTELQGLRFRGSGAMSAGSEHTIDGKRYDGELHFVFYNNKYKDLKDADDKKDGLVVFVILVQTIQGTRLDDGMTTMFSTFLEENLPPIFPYEMNYTAAVNLTIFFDRECQFYTYHGSTTTPPCHESVQWIILRDPIMVTERAYFLLTRLQSRGDFNSRFGNYRTTQPLNDRRVIANFDKGTPMNVPPINGNQMVMAMWLRWHMLNQQRQHLMRLARQHLWDVVASWMDHFKKMKK